MSTRTYQPPVLDAGIDLDLSRNEGPPAEGLDLQNLPRELIRRYPETSQLREAIAKHNGARSDQVVVTAGADDALLRCALARLGPGRKAVATTPTFAMIDIYCRQVGARLDPVDWWDGPFPVFDFETRAESADVTFLVSPNNPTGAAVTELDLRRVAETAPFVVFDAVYEDFTSEQLTPTALEFDNVVVVRSLSKAFGLAGLRVGYTLSSTAVASELAGYGNPFPVSGVSAAIAIQRLGQPNEVTERYVKTVRENRDLIQELLAERGTGFVESHGNFVLFKAPAQVADDLAAEGIAIRTFPGRTELDGWHRLTIPSNESDITRVLAALKGAL